MIYKIVFNYKGDSIIEDKYKGKSEPVELSSWDNLLTTSSVTSQQLIDKYLNVSSRVGTRISNSRILKTVKLSVENF